MSITNRTPNTIILHAHDDSRTVKDGQAAAPITPGELVEITGENASATVEHDLQPHGTAPSTDTEGSAMPRFAVELAKAGKGIDDDYAAGDHVEYRTFQTGEEPYAWLAAGESVAVDDPLESAGNGALQPHDGAATTGDGTGGATETVYGGAVVAHATEAVDNSGEADPARVRVEVK